MRAIGGWCWCPKLTARWNGTISTTMPGTICSMWRRMWLACLENLAQADKMNIAALGNMVRQLHVHVIARHEGDAAWPGPVWGWVTCWPMTRPRAPHACKACTPICWRDALFGGVAIAPVIIFGQIRLVHFAYEPHCRMRPKRVIEPLIGLVPALAAA